MVNDQNLIGQEKTGRQAGNISEWYNAYHMVNPQIHFPVPKRKKGEAREKDLYTES